MCFVLGIEVKCEDVTKTPGSNVTVTCTVDYSRIPNASTSCGFRFFAIAENDQNVPCEDSTYKCDTFVTEIRAQILKPETRQYGFIVRTSCGGGYTNFNLSEIKGNMVEISLILTVYC